MALFLFLCKQASDSMAGLTDPVLIDQSKRRGWRESSGACDKSKRLD